MPIYFNESTIYINALACFIYTCINESMVIYIVQKNVILPQTSLICATEVSSVCDDIAGCS